jgi:MOSC domain-containing protein YiiM
VTPPDASAAVPAVVSVSRDTAHRFSKPTVPTIVLVEGWGVEGDVHAGTTVQHRYLKKKDPTAPNRTQVHLLGAELFPELADQGFTVAAGELGENITTAGIDLITLPEGARLHLGDTAVVEITGLRSPCILINRFQKGLMKACISRDGDGTVIRKAGVMGIVVHGGSVSAADPIRVEFPAGKHVALRPV